MVEKRHLRVFLNPDSVDLVGEVPRPTPGQVLYSRPNPDRSTKSCQNCAFWYVADEQCGIHSPDVIITANMICGYHVFGKHSPDAKRDDHHKLVPVEPYESGLMQVEGGASCSSCRFFQARGKNQGTCSAVRDPDIGDADAIVDALGCCTRWESVDGSALEER